MFKLVEGLGSELGLINTLTLVFVVLVVVAILAKVGMLKLPGRERKQTVVDPYTYNPHPPGQAKVCGEHAEKLVRVETKIEGIEGDIKEIKVDVKELNKRRT